MTRAEALAVISAQVPELAAKAGLALTDTAATFGPAIDASLKALGIARASWPTAVVAATSADDYEALLAYHALRRIWQALAAKEDVSLSGTLSLSRSQVFRQVETLLAEARAEVERRGLVLGGGVTLTRFTLDFLEPEPVEVV